MRREDVDAGAKRGCEHRERRRPTTGAEAWTSSIANVYRFTDLPVLARAPRATTLPELRHVGSWLTVVLFAEIALLAFYALERGMNRRRAALPVAEPELTEGGPP